MRVTERAHEAVRGVLSAGETAIDATVGNGHDTLFLAECVGPGGMVIGFDVQEAALEATRRRLCGAGIEAERVRLVRGGHEEMGREVCRPVAAVMFNLGYLPGGDHAVTTRAGTTVRALEQALGVLRPKGILSAVCYRGHPGGAAEAAAVCEWAAGLEAVELRISGRDESEEGPFLVLVRRP